VGMRYRIELRIWQERRHKWTEWAGMANSYGSVREREQALMALRKKAERHDNNGKLILKYEYREI
jgi:hypothetical protein